MVRANVLSGCSEVSFTTRENQEHREMFLKPVTRFTTSFQLFKSRQTELTCLVELAVADFLRQRPLLSMRCGILTS